MRFRHLYIDSCYRTLGRDTDFSINLNETVDLEAGTRCGVAGVTFPNVFYTIEEGVDDMWYVAITHGGTTGGYAFKLATAGPSWPRSCRRSCGRSTPRRRSPTRAELAETRLS